MTSSSMSIKGGVHLNSGHFLLVSQCVSLIQVCRCISSGNRALPSCIHYSCRNCFALHLIKVVWSSFSYRNSLCTTTSLLIKEERFIDQLCTAFASAEAILIVFVNRRHPPVSLVGITYVLKSIYFRNN